MSPRRIIRPRRQTKDQPRRLPQAEIRKRIYLTGLKPWYKVLTGGFAGIEPIATTDLEIGHALVRALRGVASRRPDLFPEAVH